MGSPARTSRATSTPSTSSNSTACNFSESGGLSLGGAQTVGINLAVLCGHCSTGVEIRTLGSGRRLAAFSLRTPADAPPRRRAGGGSGSGTATSVPVTVWDPPAWLETVEADDPLVVVGTVRRRFFATRSGGRGAKAEVEAVTVAKATRGQLERAWQRAADALAVLI